MSKLDRIIYGLFRRWFRFVSKFEHFVFRYQRAIFRIFLAAVATIAFIGYDMLAILISLFYIMVYKT